MGQKKLLIATLLVAVICFSVFSQATIALPISNEAQQVVNELEQKGYDVVFVYYGSEQDYTFGAENCAVVLMLTPEHIKNFQFLPIHEEQYKAGKAALLGAYPNAEVFIVALLEDLDKNGAADEPQGVYEISGGNYGGRTQTYFENGFLANASDYVIGNVSSPTPSCTSTPTPTQQPHANDTQLELSCQSATSFNDFKVHINGRLLCNNTSIAEGQVLLSYSVNAGTSWVDLSTAITDNNGEFSVVWTPQTSGYYMLKAVYLGDSEYSSVYKVVNFIVMPFEEQKVFSVTSNSTVTALSFDSTNQTLSFSVNGTSNTTGYVSIYLPKSLVSDASALKVYLDGEPLTYTAAPQDDAVLVTFTYHHSSHQVTVQLSSQAATIDNSGNNWIILLLVAVTVTIVAAVLLTKHTKRRSARPATF